MTKAEKLDHIAERLQQRATLRDIGAELGVSHEWVRQLAIACGMELGQRGGRRRTCQHADMEPTH